MQPNNGCDRIGTIYKTVCTVATVMVPRLQPRIGYNRTYGYNWIRFLHPCTVLFHGCVTFMTLRLQPYRSNCQNRGQGCNRNGYTVATPYWIQPCKRLQPDVLLPTVPRFCSTVATSGSVYETTGCIILHPDMTNTVLFISVATVVASGCEVLATGFYSRIRICPILHFYQCISHII